MQCQYYESQQRVMTDRIVLRRKLLHLTLTRPVKNRESSFKIDLTGYIELSNEVIQAENYN
jgi:hypothetical protein